MKLKNKLLPLTVLTTVAAITTPLVTSCSNGQISGITVDVEDLIWNGYIRKTPALPASAKIAESEGLTTYLNAIKDEPTLIADDLLDYAGMSIDNFISHPEDWPIPFISNLFKTFNADPTPIDIIIEMITNAKGSLTIGKADVNVEERRVSFGAQMNVDMPFDYPLPLGEQPVYVEGDINIDLTIKVSNVLVNMKYDPVPEIVYGRANRLWNVYADYYEGKTLMTDDKWGLDINGVINAKGLGLDGDIIVDVKLNNKSDLEQFDDILYGFLKADVPAMYLRNVIPSDAK